MLARRSERARPQLSALKSRSLWLLSSVALRPVRDAAVVLAGVPLRPPCPRRAVVAVRLVRARVHRLLRALAHVTRGFARTMFGFLRRLLGAVTHVTGSLADVVPGGLRGLRHVIRRALRLVFDVERGLVQLLSDAMQAA